MFPLIAPLFYIQYYVFSFVTSVLYALYCMEYCSLELHSFAIPAPKHEYLLLQGAEL